MGKKREEQKRIREQRQREAAQREKRNRALGKAAVFIGLPLLLIVIVYALLSQGPVYSPVEIAENDHIKGNEDGVLMVIYADFQCPACATEHQVMADAWDRVSDRAALVFRHYPLSTAHAHAWEAALHAEAAGQQGRFWEMHDLLFMNQAYWSSLADPTAEFEGYLEEVGVDVAQAREAIASDELAEKIRSDQRGGNRAGVRSTPTLFVNGELATVPRRPQDVIRLVDEAAS